MQGLLAAAAALAVLALLHSMSADSPIAQENASAVAANFLVYRSAVQSYYSAAPASGPVIASTSLSLPPGYRPIVPWQNLRPAGGLVFVYGSAVRSTLSALMDEYASQLGAVGLVQGGRLISPRYGDLGVSVPTMIPSGSIAGIVQPH
jgi:hypothetical protein